MKKNYRLLIILFFLFIFGVSTVSASEIKSDDIDRNTYIVGTHMLTNKYPLSMDRIMLASKSVDGDILSDMIIYFKHPKDGRWINAATGQTVSAPSKFEIEYKDFELLKKRNIVTFNSNGGSIIESQIIEDNKLVTKPADPTKNGYIFKEWQLNGVAFDFSTSVTEDVTLDAVWELENYSISYNLNGGTASNPIGYNIEIVDYELNAPIKEGYEFVGWTGSNGIVPEMEVYIEQGTTGDLEYMAHWEPVVYNIAIYFTEPGESWEENPNTVGLVWGCTYDSYCRLPDLVTLKDLLPIAPPGGNTSSHSEIWYELTGYTFDLNDRENIQHSLGESFDISELDDIPNDSTVLHMYCTYKESEKEHFISFDLNGGVMSNRIKSKYTLDELPLTIEEPTREGYKFIGWTIDYYFEDFAAQQGYSIDDFVKKMEDDGLPIEDYVYLDLVINKDFINTLGKADFFLVANWVTDNS